MLGEIDFRMNSIIGQQAQVTADMQVLKECQAEMLRMIDAHSRQIEANTGMIRQLVDVTMSLAPDAEETDRRIREHTESGSHTDRRLDALIDNVDKLVHSDRSQRYIESHDK